MHTAIKRFIRLYATGLCMGTADLIPGVSGGTIAFISGIYEELLYSINLVTGEVLRLIFRGKIKAAWGLIPFRFLFPLAFGMMTAVFGLAHLLSWLLLTVPQQVWSFFIGLVFASTIVVLKRIQVWNLRYASAFLLSTLAAYVLVGLTPVETPFTLWMVFLSGFIAICAMILPGISGSFILLLLGKYAQILGAVTQRDFLTIGVFFVGCILGISVFSRFLAWLFKRYHDMSVAILAGCMLGSLRKIWPWKGMDGIQNSLPDGFDVGVGVAIGIFLVGMLLVIWLDRLKLVKEQTRDVDVEFNKEHQKAVHV